MEHQTEDGGRPFRTCSAPERDRCRLQSRLVRAARTGGKVIAFDSDASCVSQLYREASSRKLNVQPLVMDLLNPTPAFGWRNQRYPSAIQRLKADMVFAFAVVHHLVISQWQNFDRVVQLLSDFAPVHLLVEFVPRGS